MRNRAFTCSICATLVVLTAACSGDDPVAPGEDDVVVSMPAFSFVPFTASLPVGGSVIFDFPAESHNVIFVKQAGAPEDIQETVNRRVSRTFSVAGTFPYDCTIHPGMSGTVSVTP